ncbi:hypothetical protein H0H87_009506 [Tephrocybe sp. NHM501043]|nr:hypothetical protein H0H87_009506 [Tephrocybe sp. NHM501043]
MKGTPQLPECGFSRAVIQVLDLHGVPSEKMQTYNVLADAELRSGIKEFSEWPTIPQIYVNGEFLGGCDILLGSESWFLSIHAKSSRDSVESLLISYPVHQSGELEKLLVDNKIIPEELPADS